MTLFSTSRPREIVPRSKRLWHPLDGEWPAGAMPVGTRVRVIKDEACDGPWREVFTGTIDDTITPQHVAHPMVHPGELEYSVRFDEPQMDCSEDGPYRKAVIWARYLQPTST